MIRKHKKAFIILGIILAVVICLGTGFGIYVNDYYHMDDTAEKALQSDDDVSVMVSEKNDYTLFVPEDGYKDALIFYPGGKVEYQAYAPLMHVYAEKGIMCVLVKMPFNLAVFDQNKADDVLKEWKADKWYIGGHSLGGVMAASYASKHTGDIDGVILLGSYSTEDISNMHVCSLYGSEDHVLNKDSYNKNHDHLPENAVEEVLVGGNHSQFGSYGLQDGDGKAKISPEKQWEETVDYSLQMMDQK